MTETFLDLKNNLQNKIHVEQCISQIHDVSIAHDWPDQSKTLFFLITSPYYESFLSHYS